MKKVAISALLSVLCVSGVFAQDETQGGRLASQSASGQIGAETVAAGVVVGGVLLAVVNNNRGSAALPEAPGPGPGPGPGPDPDPQCNGDDPLVDGVCIGTTLTNTLSVSGTGTATSTTTLTVPVTFTYMPTVR